MKNAMNWFEIPVTNMDRALACYEGLPRERLDRQTFGGLPYAIFPYEAPGVSGGLVQDPRRAPGSAGSTIYLNVDGKLDEVLSRAEGANARVLLPKTSIGNDGFIAIIVDSEGNHVGLNASA